MTRFQKIVCAVTATVCFALPGPMRGVAAPVVPEASSEPYAFLQGDTVLVLGNAFLERRFRWNGGNLMTLSLENKIEGSTLRTVKVLPDFVFTRNAAAAGSDGRLTVEALPPTACTPAFLRARVVYSLDGLDIRREFRIYADAPAIACQTWLRLADGKSAPAAVLEARGGEENAADRKNIEAQADMAVKSSETVLDRMSLPGVHWHARAVEFSDVTDWNDIYNLYERDRIASSRKDAVRIAINAGIDMAMVPSDWKFCDYLRELVEEGAVSMDRIDDAVRRVLRMKMRLGLFEHPFPEVAEFDRFACQEFADVALQAAEESQVLLKNEEGLLPLDPSARILLTGPNANAMRCLNGGWSYSWQGERCDEFAGAYHTIYEALKNKFGHVTWIPGVEYGSPDEEWQTERVTGIDKAVAAARNADVIIACIGENSYCETPGNMNDLNLSRNQQELVRALAATGKPLVLVLNEGRPRLIREIEPLARAVVDILLPGNYGGDALANLLVGEANFSGRLPFTYPRWPDALATYDYKPCQQMGPMAGEYNYDAVMDVQWPFGHGLSYTTFSYANLRAEHTEFQDGDTLTFSVDVTNTGNRAGKESVLLWSSDLVASLTPDVIRLRNFEKILLEPGQTRTVTLSIPASDLAFVGFDGRWRLEEGDFRIRMGTETLSIRCTETHVYDTPNIR